ncbi:UNVERIFIED_CONTAM: hypothetical protein FKN15_025416 [Acipenser sinensis]
MADAYQYVLDNGRIESKAYYPYTAQDGQPCFYDSRRSAAKITGLKFPVGDEKALADAVATTGPITVTADASNPIFQFYNSGIYDELDCNGNNLNHAVLLVGYGTEGGQDYWIINNRPAMQPNQSYRVGRQSSSGQLTGKPACAWPVYRGRWCMWQGLTVKDGVMSCWSWSLPPKRNDGNWWFPVSFKPRFWLLCMGPPERGTLEPTRPCDDSNSYYWSQSRRDVEDQYTARKRPPGTVP